MKSTMEAWTEERVRKQTEMQKGNRAEKGWNESPIGGGVHSAVRTNPSLVHNSLQLLHQWGSFPNSSFPPFQSTGKEQMMMME